jgi:RNA polymerase sigma factor (TIGR02999 family)
MAEESTSSDVTRLIVEAQGGNRDALQQLIPLVYQELRRLASACLNREYENKTIRTTDLVHEAFLKLVGEKNVSWENRAHFFGIAANSMREILIDYARHKGAVKRGGDFTRVSMDGAMMVSADSMEELLMIDDALRQLEKVDKRLCRMVELRYFAGLTIEETAHILSISPRTVKRDWELARSWLYRAISSP